MEAEKVVKSQYRQRHASCVQNSVLELGLVRFLTGTWRNGERFAGSGWNIVTQPLSESGGTGGGAYDYRLLANQYDETLFLKEADKRDPNFKKIREIDATLDQTIIALDCEQILIRDGLTDNSEGGRGKMEGGAPIHCESGLWLHILDHHQAGANIARLSMIPNGKPMLALGTAEEFGANPSIVIPEINPFPLFTDKQFPVDNNSQVLCIEPYRACVASDSTAFPGEFDQRCLNGLLHANTPTNIKGGVRYTISTSGPSDDTVNIPFIVDQTIVTQMDSTYWIYELDEVDRDGQAVMVMQYLQTIMLEKIDKSKSSGKIRFPHVVLNTLVRTSPSVK